MAKLTQKELAALRADYLAKREEILQGRVNSLSAKLFDKVFNQYLIALEKTPDNKIVNSEQNLNIIKNLDSIYKVFRDNDNIPVVKSFVSDLQAIVPLNERYFKNIAQKNINTTADRALLITNKKLGINPDGSPIDGGFVDKFINDPTLLKKIKKQTNQAMTKGMGFQDFRQQLKTTIQGVPEKDLSGGLQQYYRNYAYGTFQKVDRLNQDLFAKELALRYFFWQGGLIKTSRPICTKCNGMLIDSLVWNNVQLSDIKTSPDPEKDYTRGMADDWTNDDLGGEGCRHSKDYVANTIADKYSYKIMDLSIVLK